MPATPDALASHEINRGLPAGLALDAVHFDQRLRTADSVVRRYLPVPSFSTSAADDLTVTTVASFFPPPPDTLLIRWVARLNGMVPRPVTDYHDGLKDLMMRCENLVLFLPPGVANASWPRWANCSIIESYSSPFDLPYLAGRREEFHTNQAHLASPGGDPTPDQIYGEPHSWAAWNAKSFLMLEAMRMDPFGTSHFVWLDSRVPLLVPDESLDPPERSWPRTDSLRQLYSIL